LWTNQLNRAQDKSPRKTLMPSTLNTLAISLSTVSLLKKKKTSLGVPFVLLIGLVFNVQCYLNLQNLTLFSYLCNITFNHTQSVWLQFKTLSTISWHAMTSLQNLIMKLITTVISIDFSVELFTLILTLKVSTDGVQIHYVPTQL